MDNKGSAIPAINAGIASLLIRLKLISVFKKNNFHKCTVLKNEKKYYLLKN